MPACGYEFYLLVFNSTSHLFAALTREISSWTLEDKIHIHARSCNILCVFLVSLLFLSSHLFKKRISQLCRLKTSHLVCLCTFSFSAQVRTIPPPQITNFLEGNLLNKDEVKGGKEYWAPLNFGFKLPCEATGQHLEWRWQHNGTDLFIFSGGRYKLRGGSLIGEFLYPEQSGNYQCFVKDTVADKETFSRKVQVFVTCKSLHIPFLF